MPAILDNPSKSGRPVQKAEGLRESNFSHGSLGHVITSLCAIAAMLAAQYGQIPSWEDHVGRFLLVKDNTSPPPLRERRIPPFDHPDSPYKTVTPIDYPF
jgi:hypothetical protein